MILTAAAFFFAVARALLGLAQVRVSVRAVRGAFAAFAVLAAALSAWGIYAAMRVRFAAMIEVLLFFFTAALLIL